MNAYEIYQKHRMKIVRVMFLCLIVSSMVKDKGIVNVLIITALAIYSEWLDIVRSERDGGE